MSASMLASKFSLQVSFQSFYSSMKICCRRHGIGPVPTKSGESLGKSLESIWWQKTNVMYKNTLVNTTNVLISPAGTSLLRNVKPANGHIAPKRHTYVFLYILYILYYLIYILYCYILLYIIYIYIYIYIYYYIIILLYIIIIYIVLYILYYIYFIYFIYIFIYSLLYFLWNWPFQTQGCSGCLSF